MITVFFAALLLMFSIAQNLNAARYPAVETTWQRMMDDQASGKIVYGQKKLMEGDYEGAERYFREAIKTSPGNVWAYIGYGSALYWKGEIKKAYAQFDKALQIDPKNAYAYSLRGIINSVIDDYEHAEKDFLEASRLAPERGDIHMNLGSLYSVIGNMQKSLSHYRRSVALDKGNPLFKYQLAKLLIHLGRDEEAEKELRRAIYIFPEYEDAIFELAMLRERNEAYSEAESLYKRAIRLKPGDNAARFFLANLLYKMGEKKQISKVVSPGFLIAPPNDRGGISMGLSYSSKNNKLESGNAGTNSEKKSEKKMGNEEKSDFSDNEQHEDEKIPKVEDLVSRVPMDHDIFLSIEMIETPKTKLEKISFSEKYAGKKMAVALKKPDIKYTKKEYSLISSLAKERSTQVAVIQKEISEMIKSASSKNDVRLNINMETSLSNGGSEESKGHNSHIPKSDMFSVTDNDNARYIPRNVGNDMGLWVNGEMWIENVAALLDEISEKKDKAPEFRLMRGLGYLLMGETEMALRDFSGSGEAMALGRSAAYTAEGNMEEAVKACREVLSISWDNKIAKNNLKWLENSKKK